MSRILRRPMFRGGPVDSRGTGITTGLDQPRIGAKRGRFFGDTGNPFVAAPIADTPLVGQVSQGGLGRGRFNFGLPPISSPMPKNEFAQSDTIMTDGSAAGIEDINIGNFDAIAEDELTNVEKVDTTPKEIKTPKTDKKEDDDVEVTMTDLEKALGLEDARREYAADALAAASKAFFEGKGFGAIADAAAVKSKAPDIKRLAGLEEFKAKKAKELYALKKKEFAPGNVQKTVDYLVSQGVDKDEAIRRATKQSGTFAEELSKNSVGGTILGSGFALAAETFYGDNYKGDVTAVEVINADRSTNLPNGIYSDKDNKLIFEVKDKKVVFDRSYS